MVDKQPIIDKLQHKANEANNSARWWDKVFWTTLVGGLMIDFTGKPSTGRTIASWAASLGSLVALMWSASWKSRANTLQESVGEVCNAPDSPAEAALVNWQQKVAAAPSQEVAPTVIGR